MPLPPLKAEPKYGCYPWWPEDGNDWVHPEDVQLARAVIPSGRVFRRDGNHGHFLVLHYGDIKLRVRRTLWQEVEPEGFELGDWVEVRSRGMRNEPHTGIIREVLWDDRAHKIYYLITDSESPINDRYTREDLQHVQPTAAQIERALRAQIIDSSSSLELENS